MYRAMNVLLIVCFSCMVFTRKSTATITGKVTDREGTPIYGAQVTFIDETDSNTKYSSYTDMSGYYEIDNIMTVVEHDGPLEVSLNQNYPNPFNPSTTIPFTLDKTQHISITIYNIMGQRIKRIIDGTYHGGSHRVKWMGKDENGNNVSSGIYFVCLDNGSMVLNRKMVLLDSSIQATSFTGLKRAPFRDEKTGAISTYRVKAAAYGYRNLTRSGIELDGEEYEFTLEKQHMTLNNTLVSLPDGTFRMGDIQNFDRFPKEKPVHVVALSSFEISSYEITNEQYALFLNESFVNGEIAAIDGNIVDNTGYYNGEVLYYYADDWSEIQFIDSEFHVIQGKEHNPVIDVTWYGAKAFAHHYGLDLPTEAEWEYACRAGTETYFYTGNNMSNDGETSVDLEKAAWYSANSSSTTGEVRTNQVGQKVPNAWGLYDMHGNAWEWCNDWFYYYEDTEVINPDGPLSGSTKIVRGGSWNHYARNCRSAYRFMLFPTIRHIHLGFRVVRRLYNE